MLKECIRRVITHTTVMAIAFSSQEGGTFPTLLMIADIRFRSTRLRELSFTHPTGQGPCTILVARTAGASPKRTEMATPTVQVKRCGLEAKHWCVYRSGAWPIVSMCTQLVNLTIWFRCLIMPTINIMVGRPGHISIGTFLTRTTTCIMGSPFIRFLVHTFTLVERTGAGLCKIEVIVGAIDGLVITTRMVRHFVSTGSVTLLLARPTGSAFSLGAGT